MNRQGQAGHTGKIGSFLGVQPVAPWEKQPQQQKAAKPQATARVPSGLDEIEAELGLK